MPTPVFIGANTAGSGNTLTLTTSVNVPAGKSIVVIMGGPGVLIDGMSATDTAGNTYLVQNSANQESFTAFYSTSGIALASGDTISLVCASGPSATWAVALFIDMTVAPDFVGATIAEGATGAPTFTSGTLASPIELALGLLVDYPAGSSGPINTPTGWSNVLSAGVTGSPQIAHVDVLVTATTAPLTYNPTISGFLLGVNTYINIITFSGAIASNTGELVITGYPPFLGGTLSFRRRGKKVRFV